MLLALGCGDEKTNGGDAPSGDGLHAGVVIGACDRKGLERLCRYIARPPLGWCKLSSLDA